MKHFFTTRLRIILAAALIVTAVLAVLASQDILPGGAVVKGILAPLRSAASALTDQAERFYNYMYRYEALEAENEQLRQQLAQVEDNARDAASVRRENERLRSLLELLDNHEDYELVDSYVIARSSSDWTNTITLNRGSGSGIATGMCAITANGEVVGLVIEVGSNYCVVKTVLDSSLEISSTIASSGYSGITSGGYTSDQAGLLRMDYLPSSAVIRNNDQVVTSGTTVYPRNLVMGRIIDAGFNDTGVAKYALLEPAVDVASLEQVFVLTNFNAE